MIIIENKYINENSGFNNLQYAIDNGIIDWDDVLERSMKKQREEILKKHPYPITYCKSDNRWHSYVYDETKNKNRRSIAKTELVDLEDLIVGEFKKNKNKKIPTFNNLYQEWKIYAVDVKDIAKSTADRYDNDYVKFYEKSNFVNLDIRKVDEKDIISFVKEIQKKWSGTITRKCFGNVTSLMKNVFNYAIMEKNLDCISVTNVLQDVRMPKRMFKSVMKKDENEVFTEEEALLMADYIINNFTSTRELGVLLALLTGLRVGELVALKATDQENDMLYIQRSEIKEKDENGKTQIKVVDYAKSENSVNGIILSDSAQVVLLSIRKENLKNNVKSDYLFYEDKNGRLNRKIFDETIRKICKILGIKERSMHKLRKTYASFLFENGVSEKIVQSQLRHRDAATTHRYYEFCVKNKNEKQKELNKADFLKLGKLTKTNV